MAGGEGLVDIPEDVFEVFDADGETDHVGLDAGSGLLFGGKLLMRRRGGVDDRFS